MRADALLLRSAILDAADHGAEALARLGRRRRPAPLSDLRDLAACRAARAALRELVDVLDGLSPKRRRPAGNGASNKATSGSGREHSSTRPAALDVAEAGGASWQI